MTPLKEDEKQLRIDLLHNEDQLKRRLERIYREMGAAYASKNTPRYFQKAERAGQIFGAILMKNYFGVSDEFTSDSF